MFMGIFISPSGSYRATLPTGSTVIVPGTAIRPNPSNPSSVLVTYGGSVHVVVTITLVGGSPSGLTGQERPAPCGIPPNVPIGPYPPPGTIGPHDPNRPAGGFMFMGIFISPSGSYRATLPTGSTVVVPGSAISPNPRNPSSVLVSYGGSVHVVFRITPVGGSPSDPMGPGGAGISVDVDITSPYGPSGSGSPGPAGGFMFMGI